MKGHILIEFDSEKSEVKAHVENATDFLEDAGTKGLLSLLQLLTMIQDDLHKDYSEIDPVSVNVRRIKRIKV